MKTEAFIKALRTEAGTSDDQRQQLHRLFANPEAQTPEAERYGSKLIHVHVTTFGAAALRALGPLGRS